MFGCRKGLYSIRAILACRILALPHLGLPHRTALRSATGSLLRAAHCCY